MKTWLHNLTHGHRHLDKPDVGMITICRTRLTDHWRASALPAGNQRWIDLPPRCLPLGLGSATTPEQFYAAATADCPEHPAVKA